MKGEFTIKKYSTYKNSKSKILNKKPVNKGSVIVGKLSDYEKLPKHVEDHKRESVVVLKSSNSELGVVYLHGIKDREGKLRTKKEESGLWQEIEKNGQKVYVDIDIRLLDAEGKPIKQGKKFQNTGVIINASEMKKLEKHIYEKGVRNSHSIRNIISRNRDIRDKNKKG